jgi:Fur family ferric uptake transcriptional regulator
MQSAFPELVDTLLHMNPATHSFPQGAETQATMRLKGIQERPTAARVAVLDILLASPIAMTHLEIAAAAHEAGLTLDRVTLYRVLDWLVEKDLAHKIAGEDRAWRFNAMASDSHSQGTAHEHAHFQCSRCGKLYCLDELHPVFAFALPPGFRCDHAELTLRGLCPDCGA